MKLLLIEKKIVMRDPHHFFKSNPNSYQIITRRAQFELGEIMQETHLIFISFEKVIILFYYFNILYYFIC